MEITFKDKEKEITDYIKNNFHEYFEELENPDYGISMWGKRFSVFMGEDVIIKKDSKQGLCASVGEINRYVAQDLANLLEFLEELGF